MVEDPAVGGVGASVDVEDGGEGRVRFGAVGDSGRKLDEGVYLFAAKIRRVCRRGDLEVEGELEVELVEEGLVYVGELGLRLVGGQGEEIADEDGVGDEGE